MPQIAVTLCSANPSKAYFKELASNRIVVIQQANGEMYIVNTNPEKAKKLPGEFKKAMQEAVDSYKSNVSNDSYFE